METKAPPRLLVEIRQDQEYDLLNLIPWGMRRSLFEVIIDDLITLLKAGGGMAIGALLTRKMRMCDAYRNVPTTDNPVSNLLSGTKPSNEAGGECDYKTQS